MIVLKVAKTGVEITVGDRQQPVRFIKKAGWFKFGVQKKPDQIQLKFSTHQKTHPLSVPFWASHEGRSKSMRTCLSPMNSANLFPFLLFLFNVFFLCSFRKFHPPQTCLFSDRHSLFLHEKQPSQFKILISTPATIFRSLLQYFDNHYKFSCSLFKYKAFFNAS